MHPTKRPSRARGFTLTEILIVAIIIGILAAIGYPAYRDYARKAKRADAHNALTRLAQQEERYYSDTNSYTTSFTALGYAAAAQYYSKDGYWTLTIPVGNTTTFQVRASAGGSQTHTDTDCDEIILNSTGLKQGETDGNAANDECW